MPLPRFRLRWIGFALGVAASPVLTWLVVDVVVRHQLDQAREAFAREGFPNTPEEITPAPPSDDDNAVPLLTEIDRHLDEPDPTPLPAKAPSTSTEANDLFQALPNPARPARLRDRADRIVDLALEHLPSPPTTDVPADDVLIELRALFDAPALNDLLALVETASNRPRFAPAIDFAEGPGIQLEHIGTIRDLVRLLNARAALGLHSGAEVDVIWKDILTAERLGRLAAEVPTLINMLTSLACSGINRRTMVDALSAGALPTRDADVLAHLMAYPSDTDESFARAVAGERILFLDWMTRWLAKARDAGSDEREKIARNFELSRLVERFPFPVQRTWIEMRLARNYRAHLDLEQVLRDEPRDRWIPELRRIAAPLKDDPLSVVIPIYSKIVITELAERSSRAAVTIAFAASAHRRDTGAWPASIEELGLPPAFAIDPCSGHPMHYVPSDDGLLVYADGPDAKDDGGRDWLSGTDRSIEDGDIVVELKLSR